MELYGIRLYALVQDYGIVKCFFLLHMLQQIRYHVFIFWNVFCMTGGSLFFFAI